MLLSSGSFSRSAVNHESGAKTGLSGIMTGCTMGCALYFLTPLFRYIPQVWVFNLNITIDSAIRIKVLHILTNQGNGRSERL